jgi:hypothetical protein
MKKYIFSEKVGKKTTKYEIVAETLEEAQAQLSEKLETETGRNIIGVGLPDYVEPIDPPTDMTLKTYNITYRPDSDVRDETETITYKAVSAASASGKFLEDFPDQAGNYREIHSPLSNYEVDRKNAENQTTEETASEEEPTTTTTDDLPRTKPMKNINIRNLFKTVNDYIQMVTMLLIGLIPLLLLGVVLFGDDFFLGNVVVYNIQQLLDSMAGFVGIVTLLLIVYFYTRIEQKKK